jgi:serine/threonine-protein kinase
MAVVWRADDMVLKRTVAVKLLHPHLPGNAWVRRRILAEATAAGRLNHPNIARVYDYGEETQPDGTLLPYLVLEYIDGVSLAAQLANSPIPWPRTVEMCASVADALATAHAHGVVHRDVKAGNILQGNSGVKIVDFGVAADVGDDLADPSGHVWGTPGCLPPESLKDRTAAPAADVFALGLLIVHCLTGERLFQADGHPIDPEILHQHMPDSPAPLRTLVHHCLLPDPDDRPDAATVAVRLRGLTLSVPDVEPGATHRMAAPSRRPRRRPHRKTVAAAALLVLLATAVLVLSLAQHDSAGATEGTAAPGTMMRLSDSGQTVADPSQDIRGRNVADRDGNEIGKVDNLLIDT